MDDATIHNASAGRNPEPEVIDGLSHKQLLKQDAMLWAEFLYSEYKREKAQIEDAQPMPTHYDNPDA